LGQDIKGEYSTASSLPAYNKYITVHNPPLRALARTSKSNDFLPNLIAPIDKLISA